MVVVSISLYTNPKAGLSPLPIKGFQCCPCMYTKKYRSESNVFLMFLRSHIMSLELSRTQFFDTSILLLSLTILHNMEIINIYCYKVDYVSWKQDIVYVFWIILCYIMRQETRRIDIFIIRFQ